MFLMRWWKVIWWEGQDKHLLGKGGAQFEVLGVTQCAWRWFSCWESWLIKDEVDFLPTSFLHSLDK